MPSVVGATPGLELRFDPIDGRAVVTAEIVIGGCRPIDGLNAGFFNTNRTIESALNQTLRAQSRGLGAGNISDYYSDISCGAISFAGTQVSGGVV